MQSQSETQRLSSLLKALFIALCQILQCYPMPALMMVMTAKKDQSKPLGFEKGFSKAKFFIAGKLIQAINALFEHLLVFTKTRIPSFFPICCIPSHHALLYTAQKGNWNVISPITSFGLHTLSQTSSPCPVNQTSETFLPMKGIYKCNSSLVTTLRFLLRILC